MNNKAKQVCSCGIEKPDTDQWREVLGRCIPQIYGIFVRRGAHRQLAEELTQKTVFNAVIKRKTYDSERGSLENWLIGIAHNNFAYEMRRRATRPKLDGDISKYIEAIDKAPLPDEVLEREETGKTVREAMERLDNKEQAVLKAKYIEDLSARSIAEQMNITEKAVHSLLYRARNSLRERLESLRPPGKEGHKS